MSRLWMDHVIYAVDDLDAMFSAAGLALREQSLPFLSKLMVRVKE